MTASFALEQPCRGLYSEAELSGRPPGQEAREIRAAKAWPLIPGVKLKSTRLLPPQPSASSENEAGNGE